MTVNGQSISLQSNKAIFDTGSNYIFLPSNDAATIHKLIPGAVLEDGNWTIPCSSTVKVALLFDGKDYTIRSRDILIGPATDNGDMCWSALMASQSEGIDSVLESTGIILGGAFLRSVSST